MQTQKGALQQIRRYVSTVCKFDKKSLFTLAALTVAVALAEAVELALIVPFTTMAGLKYGAAGDVNCLAGYLAKFDVKTALLLLLLTYMLVTVAQAFLQKKQSVTGMNFRAGFSRGLSSRLYAAFAGARWQYIISRRRSDILNVLTNDVRNIDMGTYFIIQFISMLPIALAQLAVAFYLSPKVTLLTILLSALFFIVLRKSNDKLNNCAMAMHGFMQDGVKQVSEHLAGIKEVKSYGAEAEQIRRFQENNRAVEQKYRQFAEIFGQTGLIYKIGSVGIICLFFLLAVAVMDMPLAGIVIVLLIFSRIWPFLSMLQSSMQFSIMMLPAWRNYQQWYDECLAARDDSGAVTAERPANQRRVAIDGAITADTLTFSYGGEKEPAVDGLTLNVECGQITALTGVSGSGKSTLADLLLGLLTPQSGGIMLNGQMLGGDLLASWRNSIGYVPQETVLFNSSIRDNLLWVKPDATDEELQEALQLAAADEFIKELPQGLDTPLGERGSGLSGGEKQRIALARALLRKPALLVLDEATSALDVRNERRIQQMLEGLRGKTTVLVIAHRLSTLKNADKLIVMDKGKVVECGRYAELVARRGGAFHELATTLA